MREIKIHKELNREPIKFEKELGIRFYKEIIFKFNKLEDLDDEIIFSFDELRKDFNLQNQVDFKEFMMYFHTEIDGRKSVFKTDEGNEIGGGVFSTMIYKDNRLGVMINPYHKQYIYSKLDIDKWHSVKGNQAKIKMLNIQEKEKIKLTGMMTTFLSDKISGKYNQRLVDLLMQFNGSGIFAIKWDTFKKIMMIPEKYTASDIERQVLKPSIKELKKIGINISKIEKFKKGRSIESIKIIFNYIQIKSKPSTNIKEVEYAKPTEQLSPLELAKGIVARTLIKNKNHKLLAELSLIMTNEQLEEFKTKNTLN